jgi:hypothetical protein
MTIPKSERTDRRQGFKINWDELARQWNNYSPREMAEDLYINQGLTPPRISQEIEDWLGLN